MVIFLLAARRLLPVQRVQPAAVSPFPPLKWLCSCYTRAAVRFPFGACGVRCGVGHEVMNFFL